VGVGEQYPRSNTGKDREECTLSLGDGCRHGWLSMPTVSLRKTFIYYVGDKVQII